MKVQELNQDGSVRLDDNGNPVERNWSPEMWGRMKDFWGDRLRWRLRPEEENKPKRGK